MAVVKTEENNKREKTINNSIVYGESQPPKEVLGFYFLLKVVLHFYFHMFG